MPRVPETRASLILRLPSADDGEAWREFVSIYEPFVYRFAIRGGLQDADARELVQEVMVSVARAVGKWRPDRQQAKFRTWLFRIARNQLLDVLTRLKGQSARRQLDTETGFDRFPDSSGTQESQLRLEHRRELFRWAAQRVQQNVKDSTWRAFWMTAVDQIDPETVAEELKMTTGAVYIARSRVLCKLRDEVRKWEDNDAMS
ncbi:MAG: sigma-70 family RNA polymerase sigma factor [Planctomycetaceae bacterium]|nr:sigma-70 family RNA polymerase sigma factor [Planctomycetaceae bacterium]